LDISGLGSDVLRAVATDSRHRIDIEALEQAIHDDRRAGLTPFLVVGSAGTVNTGAIDDLTSLANLCESENLWLHVDGAYGALAMLSPDLAPRLKGIERADSLAFDFHKWGQVPYDAGFILSRGFPALKAWFTIKVHGTNALGAVISHTCELARYLERRIVHTSELELLAPVELNIVCFRYRAHDSDRINAQIVVDLQECGSVAPSTTSIHGHIAIRAAIVNHRTSRAEIDTLVDETLALGRSHQRDSTRRYIGHPDQYRRLDKC
jgi:glutamate/tyrosine decarboxylase-like PLP-dependent enzyme